jgi:outer membrane protein insertion porin family
MSVNIKMFKKLLTINYYISKWKHLGVFFFAMVLLSSCNTTKYLEEDQYLLKKNKITIVTEADEKETGSLAYQLYYQKKQTPNRKWLWSFRARLWWYYKAQKHIENRTYIDTAQQVLVTDTSFFYKSILKRLSEPPALYNQEIIDKTAQSMQYHLNNKGFYDAKVTTEVSKKRKFVTVHYKAVTGELMRIREVKYTTNDANLQPILSKLEETSLLKSNAPLESQSFSQEKNRLVKEIKNNGFKNFYPNYILYEGDSVSRGTKVEAIILRPTDSTFHQQFYVGKIYVHVQYNPAQSLIMQYDTVFQDGFYFIQQTDEPNFIDKKVLFNSISIQPGELYRMDKLAKTNVRLGQLGVYKFVSIKTKEILGRDSTEKNYLDYNIYLTPANKMSFGFSGDVNYITGDQFIQSNVLGAFVSGSFENRNIFKGAELLSLKAGFGLEVPVNLIGDESFKSVSQDYRLQADLTFPPFSDNYNMRITSAFNQISRTGLYDNTSLTLALGIDRKMDQAASLSINLPTLSYITSSLDSAFINIIGDDPRYNPQMILGSSFGLQKSLQHQRSKERWNFSLKGDFSGLITYFIDQAINPDASFKFGPKKINYSQFAIFEGEVRYFKTFGDNLTIGSRFNTGVGFSFFETKENGIPYIKQFFVGGTNSIRGWKERQLGPGGSQRDTVSLTQSFQTGDFKVLGNIEARFGLDRVFAGMEGAIFIDAGNVWNMIGESDTDPAAIRLDNFWKRIAIASGFGLRWDFSFLMLRIDYGYVVRRSYGDIDAGEPKGSFYEYNDKEFKFGEGQFQVGIGYPF